MSAKNPRLLLNDLITANIVMISLVVAIYGSYTSYQHISDKQNNLIQRALSYSKSISLYAERLTNQKNENDIAHSLKPFVHYPDLNKLNIFLPSINTMLSIQRDAGAVFSKFPITEFKPSFNSSFFVSQEGNILRYWHSINISNQKAWLQLEFNVGIDDAFYTKLMRQTISVIALSFLLVYVVIKKITLEPFKAISKLTNFAEWLDISAGQKVQVKSNSLEVHGLSSALNTLSGRLKIHDDTRKSNQLLLDAILLAQNNYINHLSEDEQYKSIALQILNLTKSKLSFIGDILPDENNLPYFRMRTFSNVVWSDKLEKMYSDLARLDFEFHDLNNLFGAAVQTRKPVIANDPKNDPRSKGLPEGHPNIHNLLAVPILSNDRMVGLIAVANRKTNYDHGVVAYLQPLLNTAGHIINSLQTYNYEREQFKEAKNQEVKVNLILNSIGDAIIIINKQGVIQESNQTVEKIFGYPQHILRGEPIQVLLPEFDTSQFDELGRMEELCAEETVLEGVKHDGKKVYIEISMSNFSMSGLSYYSLTVRDNSRKLRHFESLIHDHDSFHNTQEVARIGYWEYDLATGNFWCSEELSNLLRADYKKIQRCYQEFIGVFKESNRNRVELAINSLMQSPHAFDIDLYIEREDGQKQFVNIQARMHNKGEGVANLCVGTVQELTHIKSMMHDQEAFLYSVSEEMKPPLTSIRGSIGLLSGEISSSATQREKNMLQTAYNNTDKLLRIVSDISSIEDIKTGKTEFNYQPVQFDKLIDELSDKLALYQLMNKVQLPKGTDLKNLIVVVDKFHFTQALQILILIADHSSATSGRVSSVEIEFKLNLLRMCINLITDNLPISDLQSIFQESPTQNHVNSIFTLEDSLELNLARSILERHQVRVGLFSENRDTAYIYADIPLPQQNVSVLNF